MELLITSTHNSFFQKHQFLTKRHFFQHERSSVSDGLQLFSTIGKFFRVYLTTPHDLVTFSNRNKLFHRIWSIVIVNIAAGSNIPLARWLSIWIMKSGNVKQNGFWQACILYFVFPIIKGRRKKEKKRNFGENIIFGSTKS